MNQGWIFNAHEGKNRDGMVRYRINHSLPRRIVVRLLYPWVKKHLSDKKYRPHQKLINAEKLESVAKTAQKCAEVITTPPKIMAEVFPVIQNKPSTISKARTGRAFSLVGGEGFEPPTRRL